MMNKLKKLCFIIAALPIVVLLASQVLPKQKVATIAEPVSAIEARARELASLTAGEDGIDNSWALWLINAKNPLPYGYLPELRSIGVLEFDSRAAVYALLMIMEARNAGVTLTPVSAYRSVERQSANFESFYNNALNEGYSPAEAFELTVANIAVPYASEHNAGLAIDFNTVEEEFDQTDEFNWLSDNARKFGFIMRYPENALETTGIIYEPWHFRFVGLYHAKQIYNSGLTLEEYIGYCRGDNTAVDAFRERFEKSF
ncbi:MAG: M15 family metallopeptidase [Oscillospiraceae bacterium]|nr:M15 family metallopeptidase [Oscillospiraceae bacterium]